MTVFGWLADHSCDILLFAVAGMFIYDWWRNR